MSFGLLFDVLLIMTLLWVAWAALSSRDLFRGIVLFIAFGMILSIAWIRLGAPDVALAEAAIGAGLTGALLLADLGRHAHRNRLPPDKTMISRRMPVTTHGRLICCAGCWAHCWWSCLPAPA